MKSSPVPSNPIIAMLRAGDDLPLAAGCRGAVTRERPMPDITIEQALYHRPGGEAPCLLARSPGFLDEWLPEVEWLLVGFGDRPLGSACPAAVYALPLGKPHAAVRHANDHTRDRSVPLTFCI